MFSSQSLQFSFVLFKTNTGRPHLCTSSRCKINKQTRERYYTDTHTATHAHTHTHTRSHTPHTYPRSLSRTLSTLTQSHPQKTTTQTHTHTHTTRMHCLWSCALLFVSFFTPQILCDRSRIG